MGNRRLHGSGIERPPRECGAIFDKSWRDFVAQPRENDRNRGLKNRAVRPHAVGVDSSAITLGKQAGLAIASLAFANDQLTVAINVSADLYDGYSAIAARQCHQFSLGRITG